jgi:RND family efflux transporter MFP subunit
MSQFRSILLAAFALAPLLAASTGCGGAVPADDAVTPSVLDTELVEARVVDLQDQIEAGGLVQATLTATVASRLMADVRTVHVAAGDRVRRGQVLVALDDRDVLSARAQADAAVAAVTEGRAAAEADRTAAEAALTLASLTHDRIAGLHERRAATTDELDQAQAALTAATARVAATTARVTEATAAIAAAEAARDGATVALSHATLRAPFDGVVAHIGVDPGTQVAPGAPVAQVEADGRQVEVHLDAVRATGLTVGEMVSVLLDGTQDPLSGRIAEVARTREAGLQTVTITVALDDATAAPGRFARVRFAGLARPALAVPSTAVVMRGQLAAVFVLDDRDRARLRLVSTGVSADGRTEIVAGLDAGELVLAAPPVHLVDGTHVAPRGGRR